MQVELLIDDGLGKTEHSLIQAAELTALLDAAGLQLQIMPDKTLAVRLTEDAVLQELNGQFRGLNEPTDVLAFPAEDEQHIGDIAISVERAIAQGGQNPIEELRLLAVHGLLHCLGYDHDTAINANAMTELTKQLLPRQMVPPLIPPEAQ